MPEQGKQPIVITNWTNQEEDVDDHLDTSEAPRFLYMIPDDEAPRIINLCQICMITDLGHGVIEINLASGQTYQGHYDFYYLVTLLQNIVGIHHMYGYV
jgi:hypothetical protein